MDHLELSGEVERIRITSQDVARAVPSARPRVPHPPRVGQLVRSGHSTNNLSRISLGLAVLGLPLFGLLLGPLAVICGTLALSTHTADANAPNATGKPGVAQRSALLGVGLGFLDFVLWACLLWWALGASPARLPPAPPTRHAPTAPWGPHFATRPGTFPATPRAT